MFPRLKISIASTGIQYPPTCEYLENLEVSKPWKSQSLRNLELEPSLGLTYNDVRVSRIWAAIAAAIHCGHKGRSYRHWLAETRHDFNIFGTCESWRESMVSCSKQFEVSISHHWLPWQVQLSFRRFLIRSDTRPGPANAFPFRVSKCDRVYDQFLARRVSPAVLRHPEFVSLSVESESLLSLLLLGVFFKMKRLLCSLGNVRARKFLWSFFSYGIFVRLSLSFPVRFDSRCISVSCERRPCGFDLGLIPTSVKFDENIARRPY